MTHRGNRLRRRRAARTVPAGPEDLKRYVRLVRVAAKAAEDPAGDPKPLAKARRAVRGRVMPAGQAVPGSSFDQLCRLADRWPSMLATHRIREAETLAGLAQACSEVLRQNDDAPLLQRERADIDG